MTRLAFVPLMNRLQLWGWMAARLTSKSSIMNGRQRIGKRAACSGLAGLVTRAGAMWAGVAEVMLAWEAGDAGG